MAETAETARRAALDRALGYPYPVPSGCYLFRDGAARPLDAGDPDLWRAQGRVPVLAIGSNRAPAQLARKYASWPPGTEIPVTVARLADHDCVYSSHFTGYGALPASLRPVAGVTATLAVTWLTPPQLARMHQTEGPHAYEFRRLDGIELTLARFGRLPSAFVYASILPPLGRHGAMVPLAAIAADGRRAEALDQAAALAYARDRLAPDAELESFILQTVACPVTRADRSARLRRFAPAPFDAIS